MRRTIGFLTSLLTFAFMLSVPGPAQAANRGPRIRSIKIASPRAADALLERGIKITSEPGRSGLRAKGYEYGWTNNALATAPDAITQGYTGDQPRVLNFNETTPTDVWYLFVRAYDRKANVGPWKRKTITTPDAPLVVALGDSVPAGFHYDAGDVEVDCFDDAYGYPARIVDDVAVGLPTAWSPQYFNDARTKAGLNGLISGGYTDACGVTTEASMLELAASQLAANPGSWNRLVITGGLNDTNWQDRLSAVITGGYVDANYTAEECATDFSSWTGFTAGARSDWAADATHIVDALRDADPAVRVSWFSYYNPAGTGIDSGHAAAPAVCEAAFDGALSAFDDTIAGALGPTIEYIDLDPALRGRDDRLQSFVLARGNLQGWPHPDAAGAQAIADLYAP